MQKQPARTRADRFAEAAELSPNLSSELWVRPNGNFRHHSRRDGDSNIMASGQRFLELADVALGLKKPMHTKRKAKSTVPVMPQQKRK
jgi:hypothetical protein